MVELGSGVSSVVVGRLLAQRGGKLTTIEHDPVWAQVVRSQIERERLHDSVEVIASSLEEHPAGWSGAPWYSGESISLLPSAISLLVVDGPPGYGEGMSHSRYPALPALGDRIDEGGIIFLDDADREPEREIVAKWSEEMPAFSFGIDAAGGFAIGRRAG
ncbi:MAG: class I SAM-dependent methyltransferase [Actinomycetota bacterium]|nr:class I SAM-dependent methyltransferase [Actinomycetota bacterium]